MDVSISSNIPITNNNRIGEIAEAVQNQNSALSFRERLEKSKVQSEKKQKQKTYYDEDILLRQLDNYIF